MQAEDILNAVDYALFILLETATLDRTAPHSRAILSTVLRPSLLHELLRSAVDVLRIFEDDSGAVCR